MTAAASLMPHLALQLTLTRIGAHQSLALLLDFIGRVDHPFISESVFHCPNGAIPNVLGKVPNICENLCFRDLGKTSTWVNSKISSSVGNGDAADGTSDHNSVIGTGRARVKGKRK